MHIIGGIALSLMIFTLHRAYAPHAPWRHYAYMICIGILVIGGVWEFMEYIIDMVAGTNLFSMTLIDTATDMIGNIIGGGIGFCMVYYRYGKK